MQKCRLNKRVAKLAKLGEKLSHELGDQAVVKARIEGQALQLRQKDEEIEKLKGLHETEQAARIECAQVKNIYELRLDALGPKFKRLFEDHAKLLTFATKHYALLTTFTDLMMQTPLHYYDEEESFDSENPEQPRKRQSRDTTTIRQREGYHQRVRAFNFMTPREQQVYRFHLERAQRGAELKRYKQRWTDYREELKQWLDWDELREEYHIPEPEKEPEEEQMVLRSAKHSL